MTADTVSVPRECPFAPVHGGCHYPDCPHDCPGRKTAAPQPAAPADVREGESLARKILAAHFPNGHEHDFALAVGDVAAALVEYGDARAAEAREECAKIADLWAQEKAAAKMDALDARQPFGPNTNGGLCLAREEQTASEIVAAIRGHARAELIIAAGYRKPSRAPVEGLQDVREIAAAISGALGRYRIEGTTDDPYRGPPYRAPWFLIDESTAEPEVNWPGELIAEYQEPAAAHAHKMRLVAEAAIRAGEPVSEAEA